MAADPELAAYFEATSKQEQTMKPGDVVMLKSGGPEMTVLRVHEQDGYSVAACVWFDLDQKAVTETFPTFVLLTKRSA